MKEVKKHSKRGPLGIFLIAAGLILLIGNLGYFPYYIEDVLFSWPMIPIAIGLFNLIKREYTAAIILLAIGTFFILPELFYSLNFRDVFKFWPLLLILIGGMFFFRKRQASTFHKQQMSGDDYIDEVDIFGGGVSQIESQDFKGGKITAIFGGGEIYLDRCQMTSEGAVIDMAVIFGGTKITVPRDWNVKTEVVSIFGGFADKRNFFRETPNDPGKTLIIKGVAIFGGGELRSI
ncbi:MAG: cell wall-active antibiotics response protein [Carboxylicivirga sp.]|jgi:predicted membrane protein|nr:cell wall-active antibiotics response protein [Carboxylicivirga sp.]